MAQETAIEWTDATWNFLRGCSRVSEGCRNCYAETQAARIISMDRGRGAPEGKGAYDGLLAKGGQWNGQIKVVDNLIDWPLRWKGSKKAHEEGRKSRIFVNSMSDMFHENVPDSVIAHAFAIMALAPEYEFQILTKRPERMMKWFTQDHNQTDYRGDADAKSQVWQHMVNRADWVEQLDWDEFWPVKNVWIGASVEDKKTYKERVLYLANTPAAVRFISFEPLLNDIGDLMLDGVFQGAYDWAIVGGESGEDARPMHPNWVRNLRDQCKAAGVAFLFKQWGEWVPRSSCQHKFEDGKSCSDIDPESKMWPCIRLTENGNNGSDILFSSENEHVYMQKIGKKKAGRLLDGRYHDEYPVAISPK